MRVLRDDRTFILITTLMVSESMITIDHNKALMQEYGGAMGLKCSYIKFDVGFA